MSSCLKCSKPMPELERIGRPRIYCGTACRRLGESERRRIERELQRLMEKRTNALLSPFARPDQCRAGAMRIEQVIAGLEARLLALYENQESAAAKQPKGN
jgi:hypothetical protein